MSQPLLAEKKKGGPAGALFLLFALVLAAGLALDFLMRGPAFWIGALPGARALIGLSAAACVVIAARLGRLLMVKGRRHAGDHP